MKSLLSLGIGFVAVSLLAAGCASNAPTAAAAGPSNASKSAASVSTDQKPATPEQAAVAGTSEAQPAAVTGAGNEAPLVEATKLPRTDEANSVTIKAVDVKTGKIVTLSFRTVYFDFDRYTIRPDSKLAVEYNAAELNTLPNLKITLEGHCDERGTTEYNLALGEHRAVAVMQALEEAGIGKNRLKTISYGKERPADSGHDEAAWAKNRRSVVRES